MIIILRCSPIEWYSLTETAYGPGNKRKVSYIFFVNLHQTVSSSVFFFDFANFGFSWIWFFIIVSDRLYKKNGIRYKFSRKCVFIIMLWNIYVIIPKNQKYIDDITLVFNLTYDEMCINLDIKKLMTLRLNNWQSICNSKEFTLTSVSESAQ